MSVWRQNIPFTMKKKAPPPIVLAPVKRLYRGKYKDLFELLNHAADLGMVCPTNWEISVAIGRASSNVQNQIRALEKEEAITVLRFSKSRIITIVATGKSTATPQMGMVPHWSLGGS